ncbi:MAG: glutathione S-transferase N-terminal domain-containing protein [Myxococcota bacterium]
MVPHLVHIPYSPWSERARWILDAAGIEWRATGYVPTVSEPWLRAKLGRWRGPVTVPVLFTDDGPVTDSWDIACWVDRRSPGWMPAGTDALHRTADEVLRSGRVLAGKRVLADPEALKASRPALVKPLGPLGTLATADGWKRVLNKYREPGMDDADHRARMTDGLATLEAAVGAGPFVFESFSYADITVASALSFVQPHANLGLEPASARAWSDAELAERFAGLLAWRDGLVRDHRG